MRVSITAAYLSLSLSHSVFLWVVLGFLKTKLGVANPSYEPRTTANPTPCKQTLSRTYCALSSIISIPSVKKKPTKYNVP